jgi:NADH:ubiquinone oxidoreductase subunit 5 (subunit L)/multisubunit Na+/H+ antiporter MnhA subunit
MKNRKWLMAATAMLLAVLCLLAGCTTTVPVTYTEPARLNLSGVNRVAIDSEDSQVVASISRELTATGKYTVASAAELSEWKKWKADRQGMKN